MHIGQVEVDGRTAGIPSHEATFFEKGADGPHAGSSGHIAYLGHDPVAARAKGSPKTAIPRGSCAGVWALAIVLADGTDDVEPHT